MIKVDELRGAIAKNGYSQKDVASMIGVTPKTFYEKMKIGVFGSDEKWRQICGGSQKTG